MLKSVERAKPLIDCKNVMFFEVWLEEDESRDEVLRELSGLGCDLVFDEANRKVVAFPPREFESPRRATLR